MWIPSATTATSITIIYVQCGVFSPCCCVPLRKDVRTLNTTKWEKLNKAHGEASFQLSLRCNTFVSHPVDSMLSNIPEGEGSDSDATLVNELDENIIWFESHGEELRMFRFIMSTMMAVLGGEDEAHREDKDTEMSSKVITEDMRWKVDIGQWCRTIFTLMLALPR